MSDTLQPLLGMFWTRFKGPAWHLKFCVKLSLSLFIGNPDMQSAGHWPDLPSDCISASCLSVSVLNPTPLRPMHCKHPATYDNIVQQASMSSPQGHASNMLVATSPKAGSFAKPRVCEAHRRILDMSSSWGTAYSWKLNLGKLSWNSWQACCGYSFLSSCSTQPQVRISSGRYCTRGTGSPLQMSECVTCCWKHRAHSVTLRSRVCSLHRC